jgi:hypothetical protein
VAKSVVKSVATSEMQREGGSARDDAEKACVKDEKFERFEKFKEAVVKSVMQREGGLGRQDAGEMCGKECGKDDEFEAGVTREGGAQTMRIGEKAPFDGECVAEKVRFDALASCPASGRQAVPISKAVSKAVQVLIGLHGALIEP